MLLTLLIGLSVLLNAQRDLKHTFGRRLRAVGVSLETRKVLLGHRKGDITSHHSAPEIEEPLEAANRVCAVQSRNDAA